MPQSLSYIEKIFPFPPFVMFESDFLTLLYMELSSTFKVIKIAGNPQDHGQKVKFHFSIYSALIVSVYVLCFCCFPLPS